MKEPMSFQTIIFEINLQYVQTNFTYLHFIEI